MAVLLPLMAGALSIFLAVLVYLLAEYVRVLTRKAQQEQRQQVWWTLQGASRTFVMAAEELYTADERGSKREYVLRRLQEMLNLAQVPLSPDQLEAMLESAVQEIKLDLAGRMGPPDVFS